jgi:hypothetical protein
LNLYDKIINIFIGDDSKCIGFIFVDYWECIGVGFVIDKIINIFIGDDSDSIGIAFMDCWEFIRIVFVIIWMILII